MGKMITVSAHGGAKFEAKLAELASRLGRGGVVNVGFLEGATYPAVAQRVLSDKKKRLSKVDRARLTQALAKKADAPNVATVAFWNEFGRIGQPPRPYFRRMLAEQSPNFARNLAAAAKSTGCDSARMLKLIGTWLKDKLVKSIVDLWDPPLAQSTIDKKGFPKPLIETGVMQRSVDFEVKLGKPS